MTSLKARRDTWVEVTELSPNQLRVRHALALGICVSVVVIVAAVIVWVVTR